MKATFTAILVTVFIYGAVAFPTMDSQFIEHDSIVPESTEDLLTTDGDNHDGANAPVPPVVALQDEPAKKPEEDATMKVVAPFIKKCQGEMPATDECSLAKGFDPAKECNTHVEESQKCKSCKAKLLPCVMKAMMKAGIKPPKDDGDDHDGAKALLLIQHGRRGGSLWRSFSLSRRRSRTTGRERRGSTTGRERSTTGRERSTAGRERSTTGRERSTTGRERSTTGRDASRRRSRTTGRGERGERKPATRGERKPATRGERKPATRGEREPATRGERKPATRGERKPAAGRGDREKEGKGSDETPRPVMVPPAIADPFMPASGDSPAGPAATEPFLPASGDSPAGPAAGTEPFLPASGDSPAGPATDHFMPAAEGSPAAAATDHFMPAAEGSPAAPATDPFMGSSAADAYVPPAMA